MDKNRKKEVWVSDIKIFACILVVLGHFLQSMIESGIYPDWHVFDWFLKSIYSFHVPLFFICSGFLYQKTVKMKTIKDWKRNVFKKAIALGIPYMVFSSVTWVLKTVFAENVNSQVGSLVDSLLFHPISPYWYLYTLFFLFFFIPVIKDNYSILLIAAGMKILHVIIGDKGGFLVYSVCQSAIWFVLGMYLEKKKLIDKIKKKEEVLKGYAGICIFLILSIVFYLNNSDRLGAFILGLIACPAWLCIFINKERKKETKFFLLMEESIWPIFLMHTLFAATIRSILLKVHITNWLIHTGVGFFGSIIGPIVIVIIMHHWTWINIFFYPQKRLKIRR